MLIDGEINGQTRKLVAQASRNGYFFVLDRTNGKNIVTTKFAKANWAKGMDAKGQPIPIPAKMPQTRRRAGRAEPGRGRELAAAQLQSADWTVLRQCHGRLQRLLHLRRRREARRLGRQRPWRLVAVNAAGASTTKPARSNGAQVGRPGRTRSGVLSTAGNVVFAGDPNEQPRRVQLPQPATPLWHANLGNVMTNGPMTYELDGTQYLVVAAGDTVFGFAMHAK